jgi:hypothetical protein
VNITSPYATISTLNSANHNNSGGLSTYTTTTGSITSGVYQLNGVNVIDSSRNGIFNNINSTLSTSSTINSTYIYTSEINSSTNAFFNNAYVNNFFHTNTVEINGSINMAGGYAKVLSFNGGGGVSTASSLGYQAFPTAFSSIPHVVCTINTGSLVNVFVIQVSNITTTGFNYNKRYQNVSGGGWGAAVSESFECLACV